MKFLFSRKAINLKKILSSIILFLMIFSLSYSPALAQERSSFLSHTIASVGSFFKSFIFKEPSNNKPSTTPSYTYSRKEIEEIVNEKSKPIKEDSDKIKKELSNLKKEISNIKPEQTVINNPVIERIVEKPAVPTEGKIIYTYDKNAPLQTGQAVTQQDLEQKLNNLNTALLNRISQMEASSNTQTAAVYRTVSLTNKIDNLSGVTISNSTVSGLSGLTDSDIPDNITASNYLPLSGGTLTGSLNTTNIVLSSSSYLNFGSTEGTTGYGIRDNGGTIQIKNSSGSWSNIPTSGTTQWTTAGDDIYYTTGNIGIGTTSPYRTLSVSGNAIIENNITASNFTATSTTASIFPYASTTALTVSGNSYLGTITSGTWNGTAIGDSYLTKSGDWTGTLDGQEGSYYSNANNLTNFGSPFYTFFNGTTTDALAQGSTNKYYTTLLFSTDLAGTTTDALAQGSTNKYWSNTLFDTRLSATTTLPNLTTLANLSVTGSQVSDLNNLWDTRFAATNTDALAQGSTNKYYTDAQVGLYISGSSTIPHIGGSSYGDMLTWSGSAWQTSATSSLNIAISETSGTLAVNKGGTGQDLSASSGILNLYSGTASTIATSSLGLLTTDVAEGTNQYWTNDRFDNRLSATTTLPNLTTLLGLTNATTTNITSTNSWLGNILSGTWNGTAIGDSYLTKSGDWTGTLDTYEASSLLSRANHTGTQGVATLSNYDWTFLNNYGAINLTGSSTKPIWAQGGLNASSTSNFVYASTTALTISGNSYLGTVSSGAWNGTAISNQYGGTGLDSSALTGLAQIVSGTWSASSTLSTAYGGTGWNSLQANTVLLGNGAGRISTTTAGTDGYVLGLSAGVPTWLATSTLSTITGTLAVAKGGTGQTSFGQGWLNSDGTTLTSSTSPTINYIYATSTTATSTFPYLSITTNSNLGTVVGGTWQGTAVGDAYLTKSGDWTGTLDTYEASSLLARANHTGTQGVATLSNYDWTFLNNYGAINLTGSSTKPIWAQGGLNASSTSNFVYASTTALTVSGSAYIGSLNGPLQANNGLVSATTSIGSIYGGTGIDSSALTGLAQIVSGTWSASSTLSTAFGGTGWNSMQANSILLGNGAGRISTTTAGTDGYVLALSAGVPTWLATSTLSTITGTLAVGKGGTGAATLTGLLQGNGTSAITGVAGTAGQFPYYNGTDTLLATSSLFLATSGNVGIGTTEPVGKLEIRENVLAWDTQGATISLNPVQNAGYASPKAQITAFVPGVVGNSASGRLVFRTSNAGTLGDRMIITDTGNVGIGTTTPAREIHIASGRPDILIEETDASTNEKMWRITADGGVFSIGTTDDTHLGDSVDVIKFLRNGSDPQVSDIIFQTAANVERMRINNDGNVGIGTTSPGAKLDVSGTGNINVSIDATGGNGAGIYFKSSGRDTWHIGNSIAVASRLDVTDTSTGSTGVYISSGATSWTSNSDIRLKTNITNLSNALERLNRIRGVNFNWIDPNANSGAQIGVIAQEIESVFPEIVDTQGEYWGVQYEKLTPILIEAVNELNAKVDLFASSTIFSSYLVTPTSTPAMVIDSSGNVGIGTTTPAYKLQVMGDIAATSFINISTKQAKKDIAYLSSSQEEDFLDKIKNTRLAKYHYSIENENNPLRLGLIAEEAPSEILSVDGKGVDVYKMATFTLGGVKALQKEIENLKIDLVALSASGASSSGTGSDGLFAWILDKFSAIGITFGQDKIGAKNLCTKKSNGDEVCIDGDKLQELLDKNNISQTSSSSEVVSSSSSSEAVSSSSSSEASSSSSESSSSSSEAVSSSSSSETSSASAEEAGSSSSEVSSSSSESSSSSSSESSSSSSSSNQPGLPSGDQAGLTSSSGASSESSSESSSSDSSSSSESSSSEPVVE